MTFRVPILYFCVNTAEGCGFSQAFSSALAHLKASQCGGDIGRTRVLPCQFAVVEQRPGTPTHGDSNQSLSIKSTNQMCPGEAKGALRHHSFYFPENQNRHENGQPDHLRGKCMTTGSWGTHEPSRRQSLSASLLGDAKLFLRLFSACKSSPLEPKTTGIHGLLILLIKSHGSICGSSWGMLA